MRTTGPRSGPTLRPETQSLLSWFDREREHVNSARAPIEEIRALLAASKFDEVRGGVDILREVKEPPPREEPQGQPQSAVAEYNPSASSANAAASPKPTATLLGSLIPMVFFISWAASLLLLIQHVASVFRDGVRIRLPGITALCLVMAFLSGFVWLHRIWSALPEHQLPRVGGKRVSARAAVGRLLLPGYQLYWLGFMIFALIGAVPLAQAAGRQLRILAAALYLASILLVGLWCGALLAQTGSSDEVGARAAALLIGLLTLTAISALFWACFLITLEAQVARARRNRGTASA